MPGLPELADPPLTVDAADRPATATVPAANGAGALAEQQRQAAVTATVSPEIRCADEPSPPGPRAWPARHS